MRIFMLAATAAAAGGLAIATPVSAQTVGFGSTPGGGWTNSAATAIAKVVVDHTKIKMRVQPQGTEPMNNVNANIMQFGMSNSFDLSFFARGAAYYKGDGMKKDIRAAAVLSPLYVAMFVRKNSKMYKISDIKGKRVSSDFTAQKTIKQTMGGLLTNAGLTWNDVQKVPAPNVPRSADDFIAGKTDVLFFALGSAKVIQASAKVGGLRALQLDDSPAAIARTRNELPGSYVVTANPRKGLEGVDKPTKVLAFDMIINTNDKVPADTVYNVLKALHANKKELVATFPGLRMFDPGQMYKPVDGVTYHPGAVRFLKEVKQWPSS